MGDSYDYDYDPPYDPFLLVENITPASCFPPSRSSGLMELAAH